jgi:hypothetical protein
LARWLRHGACGCPVVRGDRARWRRQDPPPICCRGSRVPCSDINGTYDEKSCRGGSCAEHAQVLRDGPNALHSTTRRSMPLKARDSKSVPNQSARITLQTCVSWPLQDARSGRIFDFEPRTRLTRAIRRVDPLGHDALQTHVAGVSKDRRAITKMVIVQDQPTTRACGRAASLVSVCALSMA